MENAFTRSNLIRRTWVNMIQGTHLADTFSIQERDIRFELYKEIDDDVRNKMIELMRDHASTCKEQNQVTGIVVMGHDVIHKDQCRDIEFYAIEAARLVTSEMISNL